MTLGRTLLLSAACMVAGQAWAAEPLRIGVASDYSGPYADLGGPRSALAATMAVEDFGGTVLGRHILKRLSAATLSRSAAESGCKLADFAPAGK